MLRSQVLPFVCGAAVVFGATTPPLYGQLEPATRYRLLEGTTLAGGPTGLPPTPLTGGFYLLPVEPGPCDVYHVADFRAVSPYFIEVMGQGDY